MGRSSTTRKPLEDGDELALLLEKVLVDQHELLLKRLDLRISSLATILESKGSPRDFLTPRSPSSRGASRSFSRNMSRSTSTVQPALKAGGSRVSMADEREAPAPSTRPSLAEPISAEPSMEKQVSLRVSVQSSEGAAPVASPKETFQWPTGGSASRLRSRSLSRGLSRSASMAPEPEVKGQTSRASEDVDELAVQHETSAQSSGSLRMPQKLPDKDTSGRSTVQSAASELRNSEDGLNSYDLAHRHGSRVDTFKKQIMMSTSDVVGSNDEPSLYNGYCSGVQRRCNEIVKSNVCELFFALMILSNSIYLGIQLDATARSFDQVQSQQHIFFTVNMVYAVVFLLEVLLRLFASGLYKYLLGQGWAWNWLDVFVVSSTWVELGLSELEGANGMSNSNLRLLRIIKVSRLARVLRVLRVVQYVRPLRTLMHCLVDTTKSFVWAMLLLILMMYVFGLLFTDATLDYLRDYGGEETTQIYRDLRHFFGTVPASMTTLFRAISNGLDWGEAMDLLSQSVGDGWVMLFNLYISFVSFAVLNVMTGVFCHSAIKAAERDHEMVIHSLLQSKKEFKDLVANLFNRIDDLGLGMITISEFEKHFNDEAVRAFFESLEMGAADAWTLFASLDADGDNVISLKDFTERCILLHGPARSVDLFALTTQTAKLREQLKHIEEVQYGIARLSRRTQTFLEETQDGTETMMSLPVMIQEPGVHCRV